jgi:Rrf2 family transcriptional regulator, iron-sulfur cluster assembly transcription factor
MFRYGKMTQNAVAAISRLAELYAEPARKASSAEIAKDCGISQPLIAKILSTLAQEGLLAGAPGPGGGYRLARPPKEISVYMVARLFERNMKSMKCPFGRAWCGCGTPCPVHNKLFALCQQVESFLKTTTLDVFAERDSLEKRLALASSGKRKGNSCEIA